MFEPIQKARRLPSFGRRARPPRSATGTARTWGGHPVIPAQAGTIEQDAADLWHRIRALRVAAGAQGDRSLRAHLAPLALVAAAFLAFAAVTP